MFIDYFRGSGDYNCGPLYLGLLLVVVFTTTAEIPTDALRVLKIERIRERGGERERDRERGRESENKR